ncbi:MAG: hypothetical protein ABIQ44_06770, partial [Chloroflexia bacterium]
MARHKAYHARRERMVSDCDRVYSLEEHDESIAVEQEFPECERPELKDEPGPFGTAVGVVGVFPYP